MLLIISSILLALIITYLLFVPITVNIDTKTQQYELKIKGLAKATIKDDTLEVLKIDIKILFFNFDFYPLKEMRLSSKSRIEKKTTNKKGMSSISYKKVINVLRSFKIKQLRADIDTGDCIFNSQLYPAFVLINFYFGTNLNANFEGKNHVLLSIENRPIRIIKSFINN